MDDNFWQTFATGGAARPDSFSGMKPEFRTALQQMFMNAPPEIQQNLKVFSGYRSPERQAALYEAAARKYGSPEAARKWVAPPGRSHHNLGDASDLKFGNDAARQWAHDNASRYGLAFPMGHEPWHVELAGARGQKVDQAPSADPGVVLTGPNRSFNDPRQSSLARAMTDPILGADRRQAHIVAAEPSLAAPPAAAPTDMATPPMQAQSPLGGMLSGLMAGLGAPVGGPVVKQDDSGQAAVTADALMQRGRQLKSAFAPDITAIMALGKRPAVV